MYLEGCIRYHATLCPHPKCPSKRLMNDPESLVKDDKFGTVEYKLYDFVRACIV